MRQDREGCNGRAVASPLPRSCCTTTHILRSFLSALILHFYFDRFFGCIYKCRWIVIEVSNISLNLFWRKKVLSSYYVAVLKSRRPSVVPSKGGYMAVPTTQILTLPGSMLNRGFWLYVWRVQTSKGVKHYVGRTGDNSSPYASPVYIRMGQHLGKASNTNPLRKYLEKANLKPEQCSYEMIAHGPIYDEVHNGFDYKDRKTRATLFKKHKPLRDDIAAMEKQLCNDLRAAGYFVFNDVNSNAPLNLETWAPVRMAFTKEFPLLLDVS